MTVGAIKQVELLGKLPPHLVGCHFTSQLVNRNSTPTYVVAFDSGEKNPNGPQNYSGLVTEKAHLHS